MSTSELASSYAALILADDGVEITADKLQSLISAAKVADVEPIWTSLFAKALEGKDVKELLLNVGSGGGAAPAAAGGASAAAAGGEAEAAPEAAKEEEKEESDEDMGFGLFD
ncbi:60s acidic ribosomal protein P1 [Zymoseptoria brevis]|uniref:Large ribosomal subunit protein P1 n=1 Tax=Zymoseptoria brevis TaxID=1047168 RepID=A0A0F4G702_9PEZI|nr:60s acidic ribosomal protein P1 [Zymoseptoria brevis]